MNPVARRSHFRFSLSALIVAIALAAPSIASAQNTWKAKDGDWDETKNWSKGSVPPLKFVPPTPKKPAANAKPASKIKPSAPTPTPTPTPAPKPVILKPGASAPTAATAAAANVMQPPAFPAGITPATPNAVIVTGGNATWHADTQGDFSAELPVFITKKGSWKQTGGPSWIFVRNGGSLTITDGTFDGGTSNNLIIGSDMPGFLLVNGPDSVLNMPTGEIKIRRNANATISAGNVTAKLISFDDSAAGTVGILTLTGGTLTLNTNAYGGVYGGGEHHYVNFAPGSKAVLMLTAIESDAFFEQLEKGGIRYNHRIDPNAFKLEPRDGSGTKVTVSPDAKP